MAKAEISLHKAVIFAESPLPFKISQGNHLGKRTWEFSNAGS